MSKFFPRGRLRGWYATPRIQKDLMQTKKCQTLTSAFVGCYANPRIQKDLMQTKKVSNSQLRTPAGGVAWRSGALRCYSLFFLRKSDFADLIDKSDGFVRGVPDRIKSELADLIGLNSKVEVLAETVDFFCGLNLRT